MTAVSHRLDAIQAQLDAATPGSWKVRECTPCTERGRLEVDVWDEAGNLMVTGWCDDDEFHRPDAEFIAAAPENTRYLLDLARKQQAALAVVEEWLKTLDAIEEADPTTPTSRNVSAAGVASAIRAAVRTTLEAKP